MISRKKPVSKRQKAFYGNVSPAIRAEILGECPKQVQRLWLGTTGDGKEPNYQFEIHGRIIRRSLKHPDRLDGGTFNPKHIVEIDPRTGDLLLLQE